MSHDGSSSKSYIKHLTEKDRLDHLAFTSFPEDYLPYARGGGGKGGAPPYLVWGEQGGNNAPRGGRKRRGCCSTAALVSAIALIVAAILAAVAISVYLGVVTNLFRSPVLSLSGKFRVSDGDEFLDEYLNTTSYQFLTKAESYQAMVENAFISSSLEPAFIAARIYAFRPGMLVFFRVYLDRRKLQQDDSGTLRLVRDLVKSKSPAFAHLVIDQESVDVDENEEWISFPGLDQRVTKESTSPTQRPPPRLATAGHRPPQISRTPRPTSRSPPSVPVRELAGTGTGEVVAVGAIDPKEEDNLKVGYGHWNPVPIEDSVSPAFGDQRTPPGRGSARQPSVPLRPLIRPSSSDTPPFDRSPTRNNPGNPPSNPQQGDSTSSDRSPIRPAPARPPSNPLHVGVGSVSVLDDPLSHVDPIPMRGLRVLVSEAPPPLVASSIMSSVSLVVRPPPNSGNRTSGLGLETGRPRLEQPSAIIQEDERKSRKEQASYRFLDDISSGDADGASTSTEDVSVPAKDWSKDSSKSGIIENVSKSTEDGSTLSEVELKSSTDELTSTKEETRSTAEIDLLVTEKFSGSTAGSTADPPSPIISGSTVGNTTDQSSQETLVFEKSQADMNNAGQLKYPKSSSVEYVEPEITTSAPKEDSENLHRTEATSNSKDLFINQDTTFSLRDSLQSSSSFSAFETHTNFSAEFEDIFENEELNSGAPHSDTDLKMNKSYLQVYSAKSDIGLKYLNYSVGEHTTNTLQLEKTTVLDDGYENVKELSEFEINSSPHEFNSTTDANREEVVTETIDASTSILSDTESESIFSSGDISSLREGEASGAIDEYSFLNVFESNTKNYESGQNESLLVTSEIDFTAENSSELISSTPTQPPPSSRSPISNPFIVHTQEGHGFHKPQKGLPVMNSNPETEIVNMSGEDGTTKMEVSTSNPDLFVEDTTKFAQTKAPFTNTELTTVSTSSENGITEIETLPNNSTPEPNTSIPVDYDIESINPDVYEDSSEFLEESLNKSSISTMSSTVEEEQETSDETSDVTEVSDSTTVHSTTSDESETLDEVSGEEEEESATTESSAVLAGKIVPQLSDLGFNPNDIDSDGDLGDESRGDEDLLDVQKDDDSTSDDDDIREGVVVMEIIRHITTVPPTLSPFPVSLGKHPVFVSKEECPSGKIRCGSGECVDSGSRCNMRRDCKDNSDERNCSCADLLQVMGQSQKICDGVEDCKDHTDENNCPWCEEGQVLCPQTKFCVNRSQLCDGQDDCPLGTDERYCVKLAEGVEDAEGLHYRSEGFLMVRKRGEWGKLCLDHLGHSEALTLKMDDLGDAVCNTLTYRNVSESSRMRDPDRSENSYYVISNEVPSHTKRTSAIFQPSSCESREVLRVQCGDLDCGLRPLATSSRRRIVGGQSSGSGSWPWSVALYKEGDFQCGAVLVSDTWLVSAAHCFYSTQDAYWSARLGVLRRGSELPSPSEQVRRISRILLHPQYVDKGFLNDIAMLRMDTPVLFSDYLRPVCLPTVDEDPGLWHGNECSVVGWGKLYEIGHTFPDSLQEVRLPVISTEECRKRILFLTMYHITDNMFCAGYERGGRDACLGDSGGPLMCQRDDGRWLLLGVTSNGDGCGRPGRPGVYTKVAKYLTWIHHTLGEDASSSEMGFVDGCEGVRCQLGRCVPPYKKCDGRWDCSEGADEDGCQY